MLTWLICPNFLNIFKLNPKLNFLFFQITTKEKKIKNEKSLKNKRFKKASRLITSMMKKKEDIKLTHD